MKSAKIEKIYSRVVVLDEQGIRRLYSDVLQQLSHGDTTNKPSITLTLNYADGSSVITEDIEEVLRDENVSGRKIVKFSLEGKFTNKRIFLVFGGTNKNIDLQIIGPDRQWTYVTKSIIEERIGDTSEKRPRTGTLIFSTLIALILLAYLIVPYLANYLPPLWITKDGKNELSSGMLIIIFLITVVWILLSYCIFKLFPNVIFLIGREIRRQETRIKLRSNILWTVIIGSLLTIIITFVLRIFGF